MLLIPFHDESGKVDTRNQLSGLRTRQTLASREAWNAAHTSMRRPMRRLAGVMVAVLVVSIAGEIAFDLREVLLVTIPVSQAALLIGGLLLICWRANRVAAQVNQRMARGE
ncbi:SdpI family protein [Nonomuraea phyllanthi]|uniref:SdpI family protein n=1 Tax=Nonomuraea phyllanthi TaxID=2219224 RepID=UPI0018855CFF|nr:SdpI family protein [Nonomuraea phyllanthi]